jgi:hypothetical protein
MFLFSISSDYTIAYLSARLTVPLTDKSPQYQPLFVKLVGLYEDISNKALENEKFSM